MRTLHEARLLDKRIRISVDELLGLLTDASDQQLDLVLGYRSLPAYLVDVAQELRFTSAQAKWLAHKLTGEAPEELIPEPVDAMVDLDVGSSGE